MVSILTFWIQDIDWEKKVQVQVFSIFRNSIYARRHSTVWLQINDFLLMVNSMVIQV